MTTIIYNKASFEQGFPPPPIHLLLSILRQEGIKIQVDPDTDPQQMAKIFKGIGKMLEQASGCSAELFEFFDALNSGAKGAELSRKAIKALQVIPPCEEGCSCCNLPQFSSGFLN